MVPSEASTSALVTPTGRPYITGGNRQTAPLEKAPREECIFIDARGRKLQAISYFDGDNTKAALTPQLIAGKQQQYTKHNIWEDASTHDDTRGANVEMVALVDIETGLPAASLRKIHTTGSELEALPSYVKFKSVNGFSPHGEALLSERARPDRPVVEIASLWKNPDYGTEVTAALYKEAFQASVTKGELWFAGTVAPEYMLLRRTYGPEAIHVLGGPIAVNDGKARDHVRLHAVLIDPETFFGEMAAAARQAWDKGDYKTYAARNMWMWYYRDGIESYMTGQARSEMDNLHNNDAA
jgi:hypothetical protein